MIRREVFLFLILVAFAGLTGCTRIENYIRGAFYQADQDVPGDDPYRYDFSQIGSNDNSSDSNYGGGQLYRYSRPGSQYDGYCIESCDLLMQPQQQVPMQIPYQGGLLIPDPTCIRIDASVVGCCSKCTADCPSVFVYLPDEKRVVPIEEAECDANTDRKVYISKKRLCRMRGGC